MSQNYSPLLGITMGEPSGIGGEICIKAWMNKNKETPIFFLLDSPERIQKLAEDTGLACRTREISKPEDAKEVFSIALPILPLSRQVVAKPGKPFSGNASAVIESIDRAIELAKSGVIDAIVTNPIQKETLLATGFSHPGHTEYLAEKAGEGQSVMMIASETLRVVPVTTHIPLLQAPSEISTDRILYCARTTNQALKDYFKIPSPRLVVAGINPHAGENGHFGSEDIEIIKPAVEILRNEGLDINGPLSADSMFHDKVRKTYDAAICMYHDQGLIPIKTIAFEDSVNVTLGLSIIRTSPDHGTALDLAATGNASSSSLEASINLAAQMALSLRQQQTL
jgi:4-hydroxythreonine-4-phosphate dehydrogenase